MKWLLLLVTIFGFVAGTAWSQDQVRSGMVGDMIIRAVPPLTAATVSVKAADYVPVHGWAPGNSGREQAVEAMLINGYEKLARWMKEGGQPSGPSFVIFNEDPATTSPDNLTCKIGYPVTESANGRHIAAIEHLPATVAAVVRYQGPHDGRAALTDSLGKWISSKGYAPAGPVMEIYLTSTRYTPANADDMAEIRLPVRKLASSRNLSSESSDPK